MPTDTLGRRSRSAMRVSWPAAPAISRSARTLGLAWAIRAISAKAMGTGGGAAGSCSTGHGASNGRPSARLSLAANAPRLRRAESNICCSLASSVSMRSASTPEPIGSAARSRAFSAIAASHVTCVCWRATDSSASASSMASRAAEAPAVSAAAREFSNSARWMALAFPRWAANIPGFGSVCSTPTMISPSSARMDFCAAIKPRPTIGSSHKRTARRSWAAATARSLPAATDGWLRTASSRRRVSRPSFKSCVSPACSRLPAIAKPASNFAYISHRSQCWETRLETCARTPRNQAEVMCGHNTPVRALTQMTKLQ